jgi:hypothetical protein
VIFKGTVYVIDKYRPGKRNGRVVGGRELPRKIPHKWVMATWMAEVRGTARRLEAELHRTDYDRMNSGQQADYVAICHAIDTAKRCAEWSPPRPAGQHLASLRQLWRRTVSWWTGGEIDLAYSALHTAGQILLSVEQEDAVKAHIPDMAVAVAADFRPSDLRVRGYLKTLEILAHPDRRIGDSDRAQLRAIRQACDSAEASAHCDARTFRNTLVVMGALLTALLAGVAGLAWADQSFRAVFAAAGEMPRPSGWYVPELEVIASLSGLASAALALKSYTGHRHSYGLPLIQTLLKGSAGAATGLLGVLLAGSGLVSSLTVHTEPQIFTVALIFGCGQYLFTRLIDRQAKDMLNSAGSRSDRGVTPPTSDFDGKLVFVTVADE